MTRLRQYLRERRSGSDVVIGNDHRLTREDLLRARLRNGREQRLAVSMSSFDRLAKMLVACDGHCSSLLLLSDTLSSDHVAQIAAQAGATTIVSDRPDLPGAVHPDDLLDGAADEDENADDGAAVATEWMLTTSGTTGIPKVVSHSFDGLSRTIRTVASGAVPPVWGLTYEATRFAGLQVVLQALCGGGTIVVQPGGSSVRDRLAAFARFGVTHLSATPTLWRQFLMHPESRRLALRQITLGGEIADQHLLDRLAARFPEANVTHIYASTETGVGFSVKDGREGFPASWLAIAPGGFRLKAVDGLLWVTSRGEGKPLPRADPFDRDAEGFVNTHDRIEERGDRIVFLGRATGAVNVGGAKVYPETVESLLNRHEGVAMSHVAGRKNPFSGSILAADIVPSHWPDDEAAFRKQIIRYCTDALPPEAVPAVVRLVRDLSVGTSGKLGRK